MQRISAGHLRGRRLQPLPGQVPGLRPTAAKVREAIFDRIGTELVDGRVLDLFAGSGALAIEALSRGARAATLIERDARVERHLARQLKILELNEQASVVRADALQWLARDPDPVRAYDLVFVDPPFATPDVFDTILARLVRGRWLGPAALIVCERERIRGRCPDLSLPIELTVEASRVYGQVNLEYLRAP